MRDMRVHSIGILATILFLAVAGMLSPKLFNYLPATLLMEMLFILIALGIKLRLNSHLFFLSIITLGYVFYYTLFGLVVADANVLDVATSVKAFIYLIIIAYLANKMVLKVNTLEIIFKALMYIFLVKYGYSRILGLSERPGVFTENNFELMFVYIIAAGLWQLRGYTKPTEMLILILIAGLSGSRSGVLELLWLAFIGRRSKNLKINVDRRMNYLTPVLFAAILLISYFIISSRSVGGLEEIDRFKFLLLFLDETKDWSVGQWLVGSNPMTALNSYTCDALAYYENLFSYSGDGRCYSVIFHSMLIRTIFDHGILGLFFIFYFIWRVMRTSFYDGKTIGSVIGILLINALSVSSFNSVYASLAIGILVISFSHNKKFLRQRTVSISAN